MAPGAPTQPIDETDHVRVVERELALLVRRLEQVRRNLVVDGVTLDRSAYLLLDRIDLLGAPTAAQLVDDLQLDHSTVTRQVGALERDGLVERVPDPAGGRALLLHLTAAGAHLLESARRGRHERVSATLGDWSDRDRRALGRLLGRLNVAFAARAAALDADG